MRAFTRVPSFYEVEPGVTMASDLIFIYGDDTDVQLEYGTYVSVGNGCYWQGRTKSDEFEVLDGEKEQIHVSAS